MVPTPPPLPLSSSSTSHRIITTTRHETPYNKSSNYFSHTDSQQQQQQHNTTRAAQLRHRSSPPQPLPLSPHVAQKNPTAAGARRATIHFSHPVAQNIPTYSPTISDTQQALTSNFAASGPRGHRVQQSRSFRDFSQNRQNSNEHQEVDHEQQQEHMRLVHHPNKLSVMPIVKSFAFVSRARNIFQPHEHTAEEHDANNTARSKNSLQATRNSLSAIAAGNSAKLLHAFGGSTQQLNSSYSTTTMRTPPPTSLIYPPGHPAATTAGSSGHQFPNPHNLPYTDPAAQQQRRRSSHRSTTAATTEHEARTIAKTRGTAAPAHISSSHPDLPHHSSLNTSSHRASSRNSTKSTSTSGTPAEVLHGGGPHQQHHHVAAQRHSHHAPYNSSNRHVNSHIPPAPPMALFGNGQIPTARDPHHLWAHNQQAQQQLMNQQLVASSSTQAKHQFLANRKLPAIAGTASGSEYDDGISTAPAAGGANVTSRRATTLSSSSPTNTATHKTDGLCCAQHKPGCCYCCCCRRCATARCCFGLVACLVLLGIGLVVFLIYLLSSSNTLVHNNNNTDPSSTKVLLGGRTVPVQHGGTMLVPLPANNRERSSFPVNTLNERLPDSKSSTTTEESVYNAIEERLLWKLTPAQGGRLPNHRPKLPPSMQLPAEDGVVVVAKDAPLPQLPSAAPPLHLPPILQQPRFGIVSTRKPEHGFMPPPDDINVNNNNKNDINLVSVFDANDIHLMPGLVGLGPLPHTSTTIPSNNIEPTLSAAENVPMGSAKKPVDPTPEIYTVFTAIINNSNTNNDAARTSTTKSPANTTSIFFTNDAATYYTQPPDYFAPNDVNSGAQPGLPAMLTTLPASENSVTIVMDTTDASNAGADGQLPADDGSSSSTVVASTTIEPPMPGTAPGVSCRDTFSAFKCTDGQKCLHISMWCDNVADCNDGSDEPAECQYQCPAGFFACLNRTIQQNSLAFQFYGGRTKRYAVHQLNEANGQQKEQLPAQPLLRAMTFFSSYADDSPLTVRMANFTLSNESETDTAAAFGNLTHRSARPLASAVRIASSSPTSAAGGNRRVARVVPDNNVVNGKNKPARHGGSVATTQQSPKSTTPQRRLRRHEWCIPDSLVCNGVSDCQDLSDEYFCHCTTEQIRCADGVCRSRGLICTGHHLRYSSETNADGSRTSRTFGLNNIPQADGGVTNHGSSGHSTVSNSGSTSSNQNEATCLANAKAEQELCSCVESIPPDKVCDGFPDCLDSIDERDCSGCQVEHEFACWQSKYVCISRRSVCDGIAFDCPNNEDELDCIRLLPQGERLSDATDFLGRMTTTGVLVARRNGSPFSPVCSSDLQWKAGTWESVFNADASCQYVGYARALRIEHLQLPDTLPPSATFALIGAPSTPSTPASTSLFSSKTIAPEPNSFVAYFTQSRECPSSEIVQLHCAEMLCSAPNETIQTFNNGAAGVSHGTVAAGTLPAARYLPEQQWYLPAIVQIHRRRVAEHSPSTAATSTGKNLNASPSTASAASATVVEAGEWQFHCGGVLVHDSAVVTSSACLTDPSPEPKFASSLVKNKPQARSSAAATNAAAAATANNEAQYEYVVIAGSFWPATNPNLIQQRTVSHSSALPSVNAARLPSFISTPIHSTTTPRMPQLAIMHVRVPFALSDYLHAACLPQPRDAPHSTTSFESGTADPYRLALSSVLGSSNQIKIARSGNLPQVSAAFSTVSTPISSILYGESVPGVSDSNGNTSSTQISMRPSRPTKIYSPTTNPVSLTSYPTFMPVPVDLPPDENSTTISSSQSKRRRRRRRRALPLQLNREEEERLLSHFLLTESEGEKESGGVHPVVAPLSMSARQAATASNNMMNKFFNDHELLTIVAAAPTSPTMMVTNSSLRARSGSPTPSDVLKGAAAKTQRNAKTKQRPHAAGILFDEQPECVVVGWNASSDSNANGDGSAQLTVWPHAQIAPTAECEKHLIREATYSILDNAYQRNGLICVRLESREQVIDSLTGRTEYDVPVPLNDRGSALMCRARIDRPWLFHGVLADFQVVKVATTNPRRNVQAHHSIRDRPIATSLAFVGDQQHQKHYHQQQRPTSSAFTTPTTVSKSSSFAPTRRKRATVIAAVQQPAQTAANLTASLFPGIPQPYLHHNTLSQTRASGSTGPRRGRVYSQRTKTTPNVVTEEALNEAVQREYHHRQTPHHHHHYQQASREEHYYYYDVFAFYISVRDQLNWLRKEVGLAAARR